MPWKVEPRGNQYCVVKIADGTTVHCHDTREQADAQVRALYANDAKSFTYLDLDEVKSVWTTAYVNNLPDSSFAYIEPGGTKDDEGKTTPRSLRHFPYKDASGKPDPAHVRNALARIPQSSVSDTAKASALAKVRAAAQQLGIQTSERKSLMDDELNALVFYGGAVKALGDGRVGGYGVLFTTADDPDIQGDYFTKSTDLELDGRESLLAMWDHGLDSVLKRRRLGRATYRTDDAGVWFETKLNESDDYEKAIYGLAKAGKLGWSTGSAPHLVERVQVKKAFELKSWPIIEVSLTHMPVEPRTAAVPLKSIGHVELNSLLETVEAQSLQPFTTKALEDALTAAYDDDLDTHSLKVATAVEELIAHYAKAATALDVLSGRLERKQEFRAVKDGRAFSQRRIDKMNELIGRLKKLAEHPLAIAGEFEKMVKEAVTTRDQRNALQEAIQLQHNQFQQLKESQNHG